MKVALLLSALARIKANRAQASTFESQVEFADAVVGEALGGGDGSRAVVGLHEDSTKPVSAPIGFQKGRFVAVVSSEAWARGDALFDFVEEKPQGGCPTFRRNWLAVVELDQLAERLQFDFEPGAVLVVEIAELDERVECLPCSR